MATRISLILPLALSAFLLAGWAARPAWMQKAGLDWWNAPNYFQELVENERKGAELDALDRAILERNGRKERLIRELIAGRRTLLETATRFRWLDRARDDVQRAVDVVIGGRAAEAEPNCGARGVAREPHREQHVRRLGRT